MNHLTNDQTNAITALKSNIHLPGGGFHVLIVDLCKEFQLPFPKVRAVVKASQSAIESKIPHESSPELERIVTKEYWLSLIREQLTVLAKDNRPLMEVIAEVEQYTLSLENISKMKHSGCTQQLKESVTADLNSVYELWVYKPLNAMLHTTLLQWKLKSELQQMTDERRALFSDYPMHMQATQHLLDLCNDVASLEIKN